MKATGWFGVLVCVMGVVAVSDVQAIKIDSVYPNVGKLGEDLTVTIKGEGFTPDTRVSMALDTGNRRAIIGSVDTSGEVISIEVKDNIAYVADGYSGLKIIDVIDANNPVVVNSFKTPGFAKKVFLADSTLYLAVGFSGLMVFDIADPVNPMLISSVDTPDYAYSVFVSEQIAYVADGNSGLLIVDVSHSEKPDIIGSVKTPDLAKDVFVTNKKVYIADRYSGLHVVDVSDPINSKIICSIDTPDSAEGIFISGTTAFLADRSSKLFLLDISNPKNISIIGSVKTPGLSIDVFVKDSRAYVADYNSGLQIVDISDLTNPTIIGCVHTHGTAWDVYVKENTAYVACFFSGFQIVDVTSPIKPSIIDSVDTIGHVTSIGIKEKTAYITTYNWIENQASMQVLDISVPTELRTLGYMNIPGSGKNLCINGDKIYIADGITGLTIVDIADPKDIKIIDTVDTPDYAWNVFVNGKKAFVADRNSGLQVVDISIEEKPLIIGSVDTPGEARSVVVSDFIAYLADKNIGLQVIDISQPTHPTILNTMNPPQFAFDIFIKDTKLYVTDEEQGFQVMDIQNQTQPVIINTVNITDLTGDICISNSIAYVAVSNSELQVIDVSKPEKPIIIGRISTIGWVNAVQIKDNLAYVAAGDAGMVIVPVPVQADVTYVDSNTLRVTLPSPELAGNYNLRAYNSNDDRDEMVGAVSFLEPDAYEELYTKKAVIILGGGPGDRIWEATRKCAVQAYNTLMFQGYTKERIWFMSPDINMDPDGDGIMDDVDQMSGKENLLTFLGADWVKQAGELLIYMVDHGGLGKFCIRYDGDRYWYVSAQELDAKLDALQWNIPGKIIFIYDACRSGSFIEKLKPPAGLENKRFIITSSGPDEEAWFINNGFTSFSFPFWTNLFLDARIYQAYILAKETIKNDQSAQVETDGDGTPNQKTDKSLAAEFILGRGRIAGALPPAIRGYTDEISLDGEKVQEISAWDIEGANPISRVWAVIKPPYIDHLPLDMPVTGLDTIELSDPDGDGTYTGDYDGFTIEGTYRVSIFASDEEDLVAMPRETRVMQNTGEKRLPGDINGDEKVNLTDAMIALLAASGKTTGLDIRENYPESGADADRDGKITVTDAVFILGEIAGR